jgi:hypothetical protein
MGNAAAATGRKNLSPKLWWVKTGAAAVIVGIIKISHSLNTTLNAAAKIDNQSPVLT